MHFLRYAEYTGKWLDMRLGRDGQTIARGQKNARQDFLSARLNFLKLEFYVQFSLKL